MSHHVHYTRCCFVSQLDYYQDRWVNVTERRYQSCIISDTKRDIGRKLRFFHTLPALDAPIIEDPVGISAT